MKNSESICCSEPVSNNPCQVTIFDGSDGGITVEEDTAITVAKTCGDLMVDALNTEEESDMCSGMKAVAEPICCPANTTASSTTAPPEMNNSTTTVVPSLATTTLAPSTAEEEDANVTESLVPSTTATSMLLIWILLILYYYYFSYRNQSDNSLSLFDGN